jgi:hypothetical protein
MELSPFCFDVDHRDATYASLLNYLLVRSLVSAVWQSRLAMLRSSVPPQANVNLLTYYLPGLWHNFSRLSTFGFEREIACVASLARDKIDAIDVMEHLSLPAHAMNNPVLYDDPDGHCPVCGAAVGATLGALTTAVLYTVNNQRTFDVTEYETAVVAGAIAGGLIGSGVGILAASGTIASQVATASSLIGGGMSASLTETSYILGNAEEFETTPFLLQGATSAAAGAVTSNPGASLGAKGLSNVIAAETSYFTTGERHSLEGAFMTGAWAGMLTSLQYGVDFLAEDTLMINRPIQSDLSLLKAASSSIGSQNIRTIFYGSSSGLLTNFGIAGGQSIAHKLDRRDQ